eukprot:9784330-Alexandrium_andersonii.AAC.1
MEVPHRGVPTRHDDRHHCRVVLMHAQAMARRHVDLPQRVGGKPLVAHGVDHCHELRLGSRARNAPLSLGQTGEWEGR